MKRTLLQYVQDILSSMDSDEVNSIGDTTEAQQVAVIVRSCFFDLVDVKELPNQKNPFTLDASGDNTKPTLMTFPEGYKGMEWLKYNCEIDGDDTAQWRDMQYLPFTEFMNLIYTYDSDGDDTGSFTHTVNGHDVTFLYLSNTAPTYYTSFDDATLIFNSFDSTVDTTLQTSKTLAYGEQVFTFSMTDSFTPPLSDAQHTLLYNEAKSLAWAELKQAAHLKAEQNARRGKIHQQKVKRSIPVKVDETKRTPSYGR